MRSLILIFLPGCALLTEPPCPGVEDNWQWEWEKEDCSIDIAPSCTVRAASEEVLADIYGDSWDDTVRTLEEWYFVAYTVGEPLTSAADYDLAAAQATTLDAVLDGCEH